MYIGGLDIGTTGCKLTVFDTAGKPLGNAYRAYAHSSRDGGQTIDASSILDAVIDVIREIAVQYPDLRGFGVTSFGESFVLTDEAGTPLAPVMLYTDPRGSEECRELERKLGGHHIAEISGLRPHEMYSLPKVMWMQRHHPEICSRTGHIFLMEDFIVYSLTHVAQIDYSLATRTMGFDIRSLSWSREIFGAAGVDPKLFSKPVPTGTAAGTVTRMAAEKTGLSPDTLIVSISHDQVAAAVGAGAFSPDVAVDGAGTVECLTPIYDHIPDMDTMYRGGYAVVPYVIPGTCVCYAFSYTGGALMEWCVNTFAGREKKIAEGCGLSVNEYLEQQYLEAAGDTPSGLLVLPHFAGAATPYMDAGSKGAVLGLTTGTSLPDIYRGCMEGVVYEMLLNQECLKPSGIHYRAMNATGGGARSKVWMQMKADMLNVPVTALRTVNAGTVGSAMLTSIAMGVCGSLEEAAETYISTDRTYEPRTAMHDRYMEIYERYRRVYEAVRPLM